MEDCLFCKIIKGKIPCEKVYEDSDTIAFLDINPNNKGHTLVTPKKHFENMEKADDKSLISAIKTVKKIVKALKKDFPGVNVRVNEGKIAGQLIFHLHFHVIPRLDNDNFPHWPHIKYKDNEIKEYAEKIKKNLE